MMLSALSSSIQVKGHIYLYSTFKKRSWSIKNSYSNKEIGDLGLKSVTHIYNLSLFYYHSIADRTKVLCDFCPQGLLVFLVMDS